MLRCHQTSYILIFIRAIFHASPFHTHLAIQYSGGRGWGEGCGGGGGEERRKKEMQKSVPEHEISQLTGLCLQPLLIFKKKKKSEGKGEKSDS